MSVVPTILLIISFATYSVCLWATGFFQKRKLKDEHIQAREFGNDRYYLTFVIITLVSLMFFFGLNFYISSTSSFRLIGSQPGGVGVMGTQLPMQQQLSMQPQMSIPVMSRNPSQYSQFSGPYR